MTSNLDNAFIIGQENFESWSQGFDKEGYLRVLPHPDVKVPFKDPVKDWQENRSGNYVSSWGPEKELEITLKADDLDSVEIDGFGVIKAGDGKIEWLNDRENPSEFLKAFNGTIPGLMLITEPGDTLKIKLENRLENPIQPTNLHTHGLHVSPLGHGDNVLVSVDSGKDWNINIKIPENEAIGTNWYHPHLHGLSTQQVGAGLAGQIWVAPPHDLPDIDKWNPKTENMHFMALNTFAIKQVYREGKANDPLNQDPSVKLPAGTPLKILGETEDNKKIYEMSDAFNQGHNSKPEGYDPQNPLGDVQEGLPMYGGGFVTSDPVENAIYTINGQYNPTLELQSGEWNTFTFNNITAETYHLIQLVKQEGDKLIPQEIGLVGMDNHSSGIATSDSVSFTELPLLNPASRVSIQKWFEEPGTYYLLSNGTEELLGDNASPLIKGENGFSDGFKIWGPQVLATLEVEGDVVSPGAAPEPYDFSKAQAEKVDELTEIAKNGGYNRERTFDWDANLGYAVAAGNSATLEGAGRVNGQYFSLSFKENTIPLTMPMLDTTEVWTFNNVSGQRNPTLPVDFPFTEWHPFHIHQNDFLVLNINGIPVEELENPAYGFLRDTFPLSPTHIPNSPSLENPFGTIQTGGNISSAELLMRFDDFPGTFMNHCHILLHQDSGIMIPVRTILNTKDTWLGLGSKDNSNGEVKLIRASNLEEYVSLIPYGQEFKGAIDVAIGDVNYKSKDIKNPNVTDNRTDIITVQRFLGDSKDTFTVKVFDGGTLIAGQEQGKKQFNDQNQELLITELTPFKDINLLGTAQVSLATGDINGDGFSDIIVGKGGDGESLIEIYSGNDFSLFSRIAPFHHEQDFNGTINLASGDVNGDNFDDIIVSQGEGGRGLVELYSGKLIDSQRGLDSIETAHKTALLSQPFQPYGDSYDGNVEVTSGYVLQRPDISNGKSVQSHHANITTMAEDDIPNEQQQIKVFTYLLDEHAGGHGNDSDQFLADKVTNHHDTDHNAQLNSSFDPLELRLDTAFTPEHKLKELYGTFADIPDLPRGEPVLYGLDAFGKPELIYLQENNIPTSIQISSSNSNAFTDSNELSLGMYDQVPSNYDSLFGSKHEYQSFFSDHSQHVLLN